jgi:hypothetical protein
VPSPPLAASGLSPLGWTVAVLAAAAVLAVYLVAAAIRPYGPCLGCIGPPGKKRGSNARRWGRCRRCKGTGERTRWGYRLIQHVKGGS